MCLCVCMYGLCMHVCLCMQVKVHVEIRGQCRMSFSCSLPDPLSQDIFLSHIWLHWLVGTSWALPISVLHSTGLRTCTSVPSSYVNVGDGSPGPHACSAGTLFPELSPESCVSVCPPSLPPQKSLAHYAVQDGIKLLTVRSWFPGMHRHMTYDRPWCWVKIGYHSVEAWFHLCVYSVCICGGGLACA